MPRRRMPAIIVPTGECPHLHRFTSYLSDLKSSNWAHQPRVRSDALPPPEHPLEQYRLLIARSHETSSRE